MKNDDIEKLFSSLEDFSKNPPDDLWKGIEDKLDNPKVRRLPFWWSIAASLVVGLGLLATFYFNSDSENSLIKAPVENGVVNQLRSNDSVEKEGINNKTESENKATDTRLSESNKTDETQNSKDEITLKQVVSNSNTTNINNSKKETVASITNNTTPVLVNKKEENKLPEVINKVEKETFVQTKQNSEQQKAIVENPKSDLKEKEDLPVLDLKENALAMIEKEQKDQNKKEKIALIEDKWSMQVFAGVNNSQNIKKQKSLGNAIESQKGYNYGVKANYKLNRRWAVSTGLKISELGQQVANVAYVNSAKSLINISKQPLSAPQERGAISSNANYHFIPNNTDSNAKATMSSNFYETGDLSQRVQYLEMPMEISYVLFNKGKARINMNTGGFVGKAISNEVLLDNNSIGRNQDVNDVVFGTLLSSTLQYELFKKTKVFVEPGMNYYTQPVQNQNFNQFQLIFNFGLNLSF